MLKSRQSNPVRIFVSYSHKDLKHLEKLRAQLAVVERAGGVQIWWDGMLQPGSAWEEQIRTQVLSADLVILLLTANFFSSDYCVETELKAARQRERDGESDIVPILVKSCPVERHWISELQLITEADGGAIAEARHPDKAWTKVVRQLHAKIDCVNAERPVIHALNEVEEVVHSGQIQSTNRRTGDIAREFHNVSAFWQSRSSLEEMSLVTVSGTFSEFAPMAMGPPKAKRLLHRELRRTIERDRRFGKAKQLTINTCMSISSGQMVMRQIPQEGRKVLFGLYNSIVRNSIPVFAQPDFYQMKLAASFQRLGACFEAKLTGRILRLDNSFIRRFLMRQGLEEFMSLNNHLINDLCNHAYALELGDPLTEVRPLPQPPSYLDGDVWLAVKSGKTERFLTSFVDISSPEERNEELDRLRTEASAMKSSVIARYDELDSIARLVQAEPGPLLDDARIG